MSIAFAQRILAGLLSLFLLISPQSLAGGGPYPLNIELDLAQTVLTGKLVDITNKISSQEGKVVNATARIKPENILKGDKNLAKDFITVPNVLVKMDRDYAMSIAPVMKVYRQDEEGVWVIMPNGELSFSYGLLNNSEQEIQTLLDNLAKRTWSQEHNGLKAWAGVAYRDSNEKSRPPRIILAIQNVSKSNVGVPDSVKEDMLSIIARDSNGKEVELYEEGSLTISKTNDISCSSLEPGKIRYIGNRSLPDGIIAMPRNLPPGQYTLSVSFSNSRDSRTQDPINAWKGKLFAPPFTLEIPKPI